MTELSSTTGTTRPATPARNEVTVGRLLWTLGLAAGSSVMVGAATALLARAVAPGWSTSANLAAAISTEVYLMIILSHVVVFGGLRAALERLHVRLPTGAQVRLAVATWAVCWLVVGAGYLALSPWLPLAEVRHQLALVGSDWGRLAQIGAVLLVLSVLRACLLTPVAEELFFRGALFGWIRPRAGRLVAVTVTAVLFAAEHGLPVVMVAALVLGVGAAWVRDRTGSTTPFLVAHVLNNAILVSVTYAATGWHVTP